MVDLHEIVAALETGRFCLFYQPKYSITNAVIEGSEALLRLIRPDGTIVTPNAFLGVAAQAGLLPAITRHLVPLLINDMAVLHNTRYSPVSFNTTAGDFADDTLLNLLLSELDRSGLAPSALEVEITESEAIASDACVRINIERVRSAGFGLAMDDFGTGYSSVDTLSQWPFSTIKIDQGLVQRMLDSEKCAHIVRTAIRLAHDLDIDVVAEGVETEAQYQFLLQAGCTKMQGYLISRPLPLAELLSHSEFTGCSVALAVGLIHIALMDHVEWRRELASFAVRTAMLPAEAAARRVHNYPRVIAEQCMAGRWFLQEGAVFSRLPDFSIAATANRDAFAVATEIIANVRAGADMDEINALLARLQINSLTMMGAMMNLENHAFMQIYRPYCVAQPEAGATEHA